MPRYLALAFLLLLPACQPVPHPFADAHVAAGAPILAVSDAVGMDVLPVKGAPVAASDALTRGMVGGLQAAEVPASTKLDNANSFRLAGDASGMKPAGTKMTGPIEWIVTNARGKRIGQDTQTVAIDADAWRTGADSLRDLGQAESAAVAAIIQGPPIVPHDAQPAVFIQKITGAPGDGNESLARSLAFLLRRQGITLVDNPTENAITVTCTVRVTPVPDATPAMQKVDIAWRVLDTNDKEVGKIAQSNNVPKGTLDGAWSDISIEVARAVVNSVVELVKTAKPGGAS